MIVTLFWIYLLKLLPFTSIISANGDVSAVVRLPTHIKPVLYSIKLKIHLGNDALRFRGYTNITIRVNDETDKIILHANNLGIVSIHLYSNASESISIQEFSINSEINFLTIKLNEFLQIGIYNLKFEYENLYNNEDSVGFLHRSYEDLEGRKLFMAFTHLEPTGARKVFPCWDEPGMKANFIITVQHESKYQVLSNMAPAYRAGDGKNGITATTYFPETPKMSTYLIAIVISNFESKESENGLIRLHARHDIIDKMSFVLNFTEKVIEFMNDYTGISYESFGFGKLDIVMVPDLGINVTGMENWGLITFLEMDSYDVIGAKTVAQGEEYFKELIAHECAHQWFGNLVTNHWWTDLWINEGIATYFHYFIVDQIESSWRIMDKFVINKDVHALIKKEVTGQLVATNPNTQTLLDMVKTNIDKTYFKSAYLIRIVAQIIGDEKIQQVWRDFLKKNAFKEVTSESIMDEFAKAADMEIGMFREIFNNWLDTTGFPILDIKRNYETGDIAIQQQRLLYYSYSSESWEERYWIPINYVTENDMNFNVTNDIIWMRPNNNTLELSGFPPDKWVIFNKQHFGHYVVNYDENNWELIIKTLKSDNFSKIHLRNRLQLTHDAFLLLHAKKISHRLVLSLMSYLKRETNIIPWIPVLGGVKSLRSYLRYSKYLKPFERYVAQLMDNLIRNVEFDDLPGDSHLLKYYRSDILSLACGLGSEPCQRTALKKLTQWINNPTETKLPSKMMNIILCSGMRNAPDAVWDELWKKWLGNHDNDLMQALGCTFSVIQLEKLLFGVAHYDTIYQTYYLPDAIEAAASGSYHGVYAAIVFLCDYWQPIDETLFGKSIKESIYHIITTMDEEDQFQMFQNLIAKRSLDLSRLGLNLHHLNYSAVKWSELYKVNYLEYETFFSGARY